MKLDIWQKSSAVMFIVGAALGIWLYMSDPGAGQAEAFTSFLLAVFFGWIGMLFGGAYAWIRGGPSPIAPIFAGEFGWYKKKFWFRLGLVFGMSWLVFLAMTIGLALAVGAREEAMQFFTKEGILLILIMFAVLSAVGALVGWEIDFVRKVFGKKRENMPGDRAEP